MRIAHILNADIDRLILYYPVSALVTLFANILQNPHDPRTRADLKLMNLVVNFLSVLVADDENGSLKRMLNICTEFERIAKVVLDKADKESNSRRKRKVIPEEEIRNVQHLQAIVTGKPVPQGGTLGQSSSTSNASPQHTSGLTPAPGFATPGGPSFTPGSDFSNSAQFAPGFETEFADMLQMNMNTSIGQELPNTFASPLNLGSFQKPFVPQDLWQMPMTLEWDWADITNSGYPSYEHPDGPNADMPPQ